MPFDSANPPVPERPEDRPDPVLQPQTLSAIERLASNRAAMDDLERRIVEWANAIEARLQRRSNGGAN